jgi:peptidoglycan hydrolase-like protein with peptidoglycan-binding domain
MRATTSSRPALGRLACLAAASLAVLLVWLAAAGPADAAKKRAYGSRTMKVGTRGKDVRALQNYLNKLQITVSVTGTYAKPTRAAVKRLEKRNKWKPDGIVSRKDARRIRNLVESLKTSIFFLNGASSPTVTVTSQRAGEARLEATDLGGSVIGTWNLTFNGAESQTIVWRGLTDAGGYANDGAYDFRVGDAGTAGASLSGQKKPFLIRAHAFPVKGKHKYGGAGSRFGAPRGGHTHMGQDVSARCGTPQVVAQGGIVKTNSYQASGAGYYIVIHGTASGTDYVHMHLKKPSWAPVGTTLYTGQVLGKTGSTGSSSGCHLHFEHWTAPGWFAGGSPYDPLAELRYWDSYS